MLVTFSITVQHQYTLLADDMQYILAYISTCNLIVNLIYSTSTHQYYFIPHSLK